MSTPEDAAGAADDFKTNEDTKAPEQATDPRDTSPQDQRVLMKKVGYKMQQTGEYWYPVSKKWYTSWINYTCFTKAVKYPHFFSDPMHL